MNMKGDLKVETNVKKKNFVSVVLGLLFAVAMILMPAAKVSAFVIMIKILVEQSII